MDINKTCIICGKEFSVPHWRETAKCCSKKCVGILLRAKNNITCPVCGKSFHRKQSHINRYKGELGFCCSKKCTTEQMRIRMTGSGNHQFGLRGAQNSSFKQGELRRRNNKLTECMVYVGEWYKGNINGRVTEHRYIVEKNYKRYPIEYFEKIDNWFYLREGYAVHHKDLDHQNNTLDNLEILTRAEHTTLHNKLKSIPRNSKGQFFKRKENAVK